MRSSRGEIKIEEILKSKGLVFAEEYSFPDLLSSSGHPLRFDFAVFDDEGNLDFLIEYQGIHHYEARSKFGGYTGLRKQQYNDMQKRVYCKNHGIPVSPAGFLLPPLNQPFYLHPHRPWNSRFHLFFLLFRIKS